MAAQSEPSVVWRIKQEHWGLVSAIHALRQCAGETAGRVADFERLRVLLVYLFDQPARAHHAAEDELLFPLIATRCPPLVPVLERLKDEHERSIGSVDKLHEALNQWEAQGPEHRDAFQRLLHDYTEVYIGHMEVEENYVIPVAMDYISSVDWTRLELALASAREQGAGSLGSVCMQLN